MDRVAHDELLRTVRADRASFDAVVDLVPADRLTEPILDGGWSVKDILAHIAWGEREAIGEIEARALGGSDLWEMSEDERNAAVVAESRNRSLDEVQTDYRETFARFTAGLEMLTDGELNDAGQFAGLTDAIPGWRPWRLLYDPGHYAEHGKAIAKAFGISEDELQ